MNSFPNNLKRLRKASGLKQEELAEKLNVTRQTVSGWETGRRQPDLDTLKLLAEALDTDIYELIYGQKPGEYPKFQRKFVGRCWIFGGTAVVMLLFWMFLMPVLKAAFATTFESKYYSMAYIVPVLGWFAGGALLPNALALVHPVELSARKQKWCTMLGLLIGFPGLSVGLDLLITYSWMDTLGDYQPFIRLFYGFLIHVSGRMLLLMILPFLSGILVFLGRNRE